MTGYTTQIVMTGYWITGNDCIHYSDSNDWIHYSDGNDWILDQG